MDDNFPAATVVSSGPSDPQAAAGPVPGVRPGWVAGEAAPARHAPVDGARPGVFDHDDGGYLAWVTVWPGGYVLNCLRHPTEDYLMLHRADCFPITTLVPLATTWTAGEYVKVCSTDRHRIEQWARDRTGGRAHPVLTLLTTGSAVAGPAHQH